MEAVNTLTPEELAALVRFWPSARGLPRPTTQIPLPLELINSDGSIALHAATCFKRATISYNMVASTVSGGDMSRMKTVAEVLQSIRVSLVFELQFDTA